MNNFTTYTSRFWNIFSNTHKNTVSILKLQQLILTKM